MLSALGAQRRVRLVLTALSLMISYIMSVIAWVGKEHLLCGRKSQFQKGLNKISFAVERSL